MFGKAPQTPSTGQHGFSKRFGQHKYLVKIHKFSKAGESKAGDESKADSEIDLSHCSPVRSTSPANFRPKAAADGGYEAAKHLPYPQIVGSLLYAAVITRPDIAHAVSVLSRYLAKWNDSHYRAAKHLLRYIRGTSDLCLVMDGQAGSRILQGYADADWGGDLDARRSTTGLRLRILGQSKADLQSKAKIQFKADSHSKAKF